MPEITIPDDPALCSGAVGSGAAGTCVGGAGTASGPAPSLCFHRPWDGYCRCVISVYFS